MDARAFFRSVTMDRSDALDRFLRVLSDARVAWCVAGTLAVNAYAEAVVTLDLDVVVASRDTPQVLETALGAGFSSKQFAHRITLRTARSGLRIHLLTDSRYAGFIARAQRSPVLGVVSPVATAADLVRGTVWAFQDPTRSASKRQMDLADIARLVEVCPALSDLVPADILQRLV